MRCPSGSTWDPPRWTPRWPSSCATRPRYTLKPTSKLAHMPHHASLIRIHIGFVVLPKFSCSTQHFSTNTSPATRRKSLCCAFCAHVRKESAYCYVGCRCGRAVLCLMRLLAPAAFWWLQRTSERSPLALTSTSGCLETARWTPPARCAHHPPLCAFFCACMRMCPDLEEERHGPPSGGSPLPLTCFSKLKVQGAL